MEVFFHRLRRFYYGLLGLTSFPLLAFYGIVALPLKGGDGAGAALSLLMILPVAALVGFIVGVAYLYKSAELLAQKRLYLLLLVLESVISFGLGGCLLLWMSNGNGVKWTAQDYIYLVVPGVVSGVLMTAIEIIRARRAS